VVGSYLKVAGVILVVGIVAGLFMIIFIDAWAAAGVFGATLVAFVAIAALAWWVDRKRARPDY
jgi:hypothetical protein